MTAAPVTAVDQLCVNTIRTLSMDAVQQANSGHPGTPMALAPLAYRLFTRHMKHDPATPDWADRDRFVLSCGHASMLLYSVLHLSGYEVSLDDLRNFRQLHSPTAGHPERNELPGIETTTGPLGQGISNAVGMALAERMLAATFNERAGEPLVDHWTWVLASDGDIMEGVQAEAASLAGHLQLGRLVVFWDDNRITIDGSTELALSEDVAARYEAYGWQVLRLDDVDDLEAIDEVVAEARADERPTLVVTRTHIGIGSPLQDSPKAHGAPLGADNIRITKENYGWPADELFLVPDEVREAFAAVRERGAAEHTAWRERLDRVRAADGRLVGEFERRFRGALPPDWDAGLDALDFSGESSLATRQASGKAINAIAPHVPELVGGSADLAESNLTDIHDGGSVAAGAWDARNIHYGVREHAMAAISNGMLAHGGVRPFAGTFLIFSDYMRPAVRLAALMQLPMVYVFTHDSVWLGEDGPTHQPVEHIASLRAMPNLLTLRPAEANETVEAWRVALQQTDRPVALMLTRQKLAPFRYGEDSELERPQVERGAYVVRDCAGEPELVLIGTGSEVHVCLEAARRLEAEHSIATRVVSMPSWELFAEQPRSYRNVVLPPNVVARVSVEAGATFGWCRWVGEAGVSVGIDRFGLSAPGDEAAEALGVSAQAVVERAHSLVLRLGQEGQARG